MDEFVIARMNFLENNMKLVTGNGSILVYGMVLVQQILHFSPFQAQKIDQKDIKMTIFYHSNCQKIDRILHMTVGYDMVGYDTLTRLLLLNRPGEKVDHGRFCPVS